MNYPEHQVLYRRLLCRSALIDSFLLMGVNHEGAFLALRGINKTAWDTKLLVMAV